MFIYVAAYRIFELSITRLVILLVVQSPKDILTATVYSEDCKEQMKEYMEDGARLRNEEEGEGREGTGDLYSDSFSHFGKECVIIECRTGTIIRDIRQIQRWISVGQCIDDVILKRLKKNTLVVKDSVLPTCVIVKELERVMMICFLPLCTQSSGVTVCCVSTFTCSASFSNKQLSSIMPLVDCILHFERRVRIEGLFRAILLWLWWKWEWEWVNFPKRMSGNQALNQISAVLHT
ncbi:MAG: hypothetical protein EXX96DRAFT_607689 [Benjaminiella poitrasii]|nr:MAG: hypothetical protein EXX96DRAFT_607689 [Benjaminiella poitrasii]